MKKVFIMPGCISCGLCEFLAPKTFELRDTAYVRQEQPPADEEVKVEEAIRSCPVSVIAYKDE